MYSLRLLMSSLLLAVPAPDAALETPSWVGKVVMAKKTSLTLVRLNEQGLETPLEELTELHHRVLSVRGDHLQVKSRKGTLGWIHKSVVVELDEAPVYFSKLLLQNPGDSEAYICRGYAWRLKGEPELARKDFDLSLLLSPSASAYDNRGLLYYDKKQYDQAIADFNEAIRLKPKFALAYYHCGLAWEAKQDYNRALDEYDDAIRYDRQDANAYLHRGYCLYMIRDDKNAIADYSEAIRLDPKNAVAYNQRGRVFYAKGDLDKALADYNSALSIDPKCLAAHYNIGCVYEFRKEYDQAIKAYTEEIRLNPNYLLGHWGRASAQQHLKQYDKALTDYNAALQLEPKNCSLNNAVAWLLATSPAEKVRDGKRAVELAKIAVEQQKTNVCALNTLAAAYAECGDFDAAVRWQEQAMQEAVLQNLAPSTGLDPVAQNTANMQERLDLYHAKQAYQQK